MSHTTDPDEGAPPAADRSSPDPRDASGAPGAAGPEHRGAGSTVTATHARRSGPGLRHRLAAAGSLLCIAAALGGLAVGAVRGLPAVLVPIGAGAVVVWAGWRALTRRGRRRWVYTGLTALAAVTTLLTALWLGSQLPVLVAAAVLAAAGAVLAGAALAWAHDPGGRLVKAARHPALIVNPRSGDGAAARVRLAEEARRRGITVVELREGDDLGHLARRAVRHGADALGMAGGDGSLAVVAEVALSADVPFVCVPAGTKNHFALDLGMDRNDVVGALDAFGEAVQRRVDVGEVDGRIFLNNVSLGAYGHVVSTDGYRENRVGAALAAVPELLGPDAELLDLRFTDGDGVRHDSAVVVHVSNGPYELAPSAGFGSRLSLLGGRLGVVALVGDGVDRPPAMLHWQAQEFTVGSAAPVPGGIDGEYVELDPPVRLGVRPAALKVRVPRGALGVSPAARRPSLTVRTLGRLWAVCAGRVPAADAPTA